MHDEARGVAPTTNSVASSRASIARGAARGAAGGWGRYAQPDPIGLRAGLNLYTYAEAAPINETDALGLSSRKARCIKWASNISRALEEARHHKNSGQSPRDPCGMLRRYLPKFADDNCDVYFPMHGWLAKNYIDRFCGDPPTCQTEPEDDFWKRLADWLDHARRWMNKHTPGLPPLPAPAPGPAPGPMPFPEPLPIPIP